MKILFVIPYYLPAINYGGPVAVSHLQAKYLVKNGHQVTVITSNTLSLTEKISKLNDSMDGVNIIRLPIKFSILKRFNFYYTPDLIPWLRDNLNKFELVHCHEFFTYQNIITASLARQYHIPYFIQPHGSSLPLISRGKTIIKRIFIEYFGRNLIKDAQSVIAITSNEKQSIKNFYKCNNVVLLPNGIEINKNRHKIIDIHQKYNIPSSSKIIFSLGRLHPIKGFDLLIKSFQKLYREEPTIYLIIAGPDEGDLNHLQLLTKTLNLSKNIIFAGQLNNKQLPSYFKFSNLFALMSRQEPFPMVLLEAISYHLPLVISKNIEFSKILENQAFSTVVNPIDISSISQTIMKTLKSSIIKDNIYDKFLSNYKIENTCKQLEIIYKHGST